MAKHRRWNPANSTIASLATDARPSRSKDATVSSQASASASTLSAPNSLFAASSALSLNV